MGDVSEGDKVLTTASSSGQSPGSEPNIIHDDAAVALGNKRGLVAEYDSDKSLVELERHLLASPAKTFGGSSPVYSISSSDEADAEVILTANTVSTAVDVITAKASISSNIPGAFCQKISEGSERAGCSAELMDVKPQIISGELPETISDMIRAQNSLLQKFMENRK